jgi:hypothetical protein
MDYARDAETNKIKKELTPAKRSSFLVGEGEHSHTAQKQLLECLQFSIENDITKKELLNAFNIEKVSKEFFDKYKQLFLKLHEELERLQTTDAKIKADFEKHHIQLADFAKKTLGQLVFLQFLQKKGWLGVAKGQAWGTGDKNFLQNLFNKQYKPYDNFFNDIVEPLFYEALATKDNRDFNDLYTPLNCKIPFLNGGLFEPLNGYAWNETDITIDNSIFKEIFDTFNLYNFTVKEDEPLEKEVAVDPEMLGKVFEELLEVKDRKSKGAFYTPREIVHYMCQESLIQYLHTSLLPTSSLMEEGQEEHSTLGRGQGEGFPTLKDIRKFIEVAGGHYKKKHEKEDALPPSIKTHAPALDVALATITVCDPAIGSGAFPVGMLHELVRARQELTQHLDLQDDPNRTPYDLKRHAIENCIYGVDIDAGAIEIAKLRFWLALVVDQELEADLHINPLPNMDYKLLCGNSLLGCDVARNLFTSETFMKLDEAKHAFFNETDAEKKKTLKAKINDLKQKLTGQKSSFDYHIDFYEVMHGKGGFDVVIGNPPYVEAKKLKDFSLLFKQLYKVYTGTSDLSVYFFEKGLELLKPNGILSYISTNKFLNTNYGKALRQFLLQYKFTTVFNFEQVEIFESALVSSIVLSYLKTPVTDDSKFHFAELKKLKAKEWLPLFQKELASPSHYFQKDLSSEEWSFGDEQQRQLKEKIEKNAKPLGELNDIHVYRGVTTGYNPAFIISKEVAEDLCLKDTKNRELIKPLLQGRNIRKWFYNDTEEHLIFSKQGTDIDKYPAIEQYLLHFKKELKPQPADWNVEKNGIWAGRKEASHKWFEIQDNTAYYPYFERPEKIIWGLTADKWAFAYDDQKHYLPSNGYILVSDLLPTKYILALLNSKLQHFYFGYIGVMTAGGAYTLKHSTIQKLPIPQATDAQQAPLVARVNDILALHAGTLDASAKARIAELEAEIDVLVYQLYQLTYDDVRVIDPTFAMPRGAYESGLAPTGDLASVKVNATPLFNQTV